MNNKIFKWADFVKNMSITKVFHVLNLVLIILSLCLSLGVLLVAMPYMIAERSVIDDPIVYISLIFPVLSIIWIGLFILSFTRANIDSSYFLASAIINILSFLWLVGTFISAWFINYSNSFIDSIPVKVGGALVVSFVLFVIGCFTKRKKS